MSKIGRAYGAWLGMILFPGWVAAAAPHQGWFLEHSWEVETTTLGRIFIGVDALENIYVYVRGDGFGVRKFDSTGTWLNPSPNNFNQVPRIVPNMSTESMTVDPVGDPSVDRIVYFSGFAGSSLIESCLAVSFDPGVNENGCTSGSGPVQGLIPEPFKDMNVAPDQIIVGVAHPGTIARVDPSLALLDNFDKSGAPGVPGNLDSPDFVATTVDRILIIDQTDTPDRFVHVFSSNGDFLSRFSRSPIATSGIASLAGEVAVSNGLQTGRIEAFPPYKDAVILYDMTGTQLGFAPLPTGREIQDVAYFGSDLLYAVGAINNVHRVFKFRRTYRTFDPTVALVPVPELIGASSRSGTSLFDIDYQIHDTDSATVEVAFIALAGGARDLASVRPMSSVSGDVGAGTAANVLNAATWDAGTDLAGQGDFINASIRVMAQDDRLSLLDLHFITIPDTVCTDTQMGGDLVINVSPISEDEMLDAWFWLIATSDPGITFSNGEVRDAGNSDLLASGTTTTAEGRAFLFNRLMAREATPAEITCASEATTPGLVNQFTPANRFGNRPELVNEFGFDTGTSVTGFHVVMQ